MWWDAEEGLIPFTACGTFCGVMGSCGTQIEAVCLGQSGSDTAGPDNRYFVGLGESHSGSNASVFIRGVGIDLLSRA